MSLKPSHRWIAVVAIAAMLCALIWFVLSRTKLYDAIPIPSSASVTADDRNAYYLNKRDGSESSAALPVHESLGLFDESIPSMLRSKNLSKFDYARSRLDCPRETEKWAQNYVATMVESVDREAKLPEAVRSMLGRAPLEARIQAWKRFLGKCQKLLHDPAVLGNMEYEQLMRGPESRELNRLKAMINLAETDWDTTAAKADLAKITTGPLFGVLSSLVVNRLDYRELQQAFTPEQAPYINTYVTPLLLCRMGEDCGRGGIYADRLCYTFGFCGESGAEDALWAALKRNGPERVAAMDRYIARVHLAIQQGDMSVLAPGKLSQ